ncbi:uncharacterized protein LOC135161205 isoform X2 [Diachasmimorpha longicaudata]|uniref:uncharacterized protein LOC135161205 isoform X2 n=1 Tax=Diachasmimorpha longicaudata TaxID=58733 RepID=UPI0030B914A5
MGGESIDLRIVTFLVLHALKSLSNSLTLLKQWSTLVRRAVSNGFLNGVGVSVSTSRHPLICLRAGVSYANDVKYYCTFRRDNSLTWCLCVGALAWTCITDLEDLFNSLMASRGCFSAHCQEN